ncbi:helix-turn-helix domain-containing protein [Myxococcota bacterium]
MVQSGRPVSLGDRPGAVPSPNVRHVIAVAGGRGGVGKSVLAVNLGVYLAQLGRNVLLIDANPAGADLHTMLGVPELKLAALSEEVMGEELVMLPTPVPGLMLAPQLYAPGALVPVRPGRKARWARGLRQLNVDYVLIDLGAGTSPATLDLFLSADLGLCVTAPEPPSVETTYRFLRAAFQRRLRRALVHDRYKLRLVERAQMELPALPSPPELVRKLAHYETKLAELAADELAQLRPRLVVNGVRLRTDGDIGLAMRDVAKRYLGVELDYVGHIEQDDSVWLSVVRRRPLLIDSPTSKSARNLERVARRVFALATSPEQERLVTPIPVIPYEPNLYDLLGTHRGASDEEVRRAYKRQRELYQPGSLPLTSLLQEESIRAEQAKMEEACDTLLDAVRRRAYDLSTFPDSDDERTEQQVQVDAALAAERALLRQELSMEINAETEFTGHLLTKVREAQGIELEDIARRTKISVAHLRAIEAEDYGTLPAIVYTRGFVQQVARYLQLDPSQVSRTYLRRLREWRASQGESGA